MTRFGRLGLIAGLFFLAVALPVSAAHAERRVALVIGNQEYANLPKLQKAVGDADSFAATFRDKGFDQVILKENLTREDMDAAIAEFIDSINPGDTAVFVYTGHGWSDGTQNYLVGTDAPQTGSQDFLKRISVPIRNGATGIIDEIDQKGAALKVVIIDACRDNPFASLSVTRSIGVSRGLNRMEEPPTGTFVVFSASTGQTALDGLSEKDPDPNGVFTRTFVPLLRSNLTLLDATKEAQEQVYSVAKSVGHDQQLAFYDETRGDRACLSETCGGVGGSVAIRPPDDDAWRRIANSTDPADFESFARMFPNGFHRAEAEARAIALQAQVASLPPETNASLTQEPPAGALRSGAVVYVDDGRCTKGQIDQVTGGNNMGGGHSGSTSRTHRCVPRPN